MTRGPVPPTRILYSTLFYPRVLSRCCLVIENLPLLIRRSKSMMRLCFPVRLIIFKTIVCWCFLLVIQFSFSKTWIRNWQSFAAKFGSFLQTTFAFIYEQCVCDVLKVLLLWSSIKVYLPWYAKNIFTLIVNRSLFAMIEVRKIFLLSLWSSIEVYLPCAENVFTLITNRSLFAVTRWKYFYFDHKSKFGVKILIKTLIYYQGINHMIVY